MSIVNRERIDEVYDLVEENNKILRALLRRERISSLMRILYLFVVIAGLFAVYYYFQPIIDTFFNNYNQMQNTVNKVNTLNIDVNAIKDSETLQKVIDALKSNIPKAQQ